MNRMTLLAICFFLLVGTIIPANVLAINPAEENAKTENEDMKEKTDEGTNESENEEKNIDQEEKKNDFTEEEKSDDLVESESEDQIEETDKDTDSNSEKEEIDNGSKSEEDEIDEEKENTPTLNEKQDDESDQLELYIEKLEKLGFIVEDGQIEGAIIKFQTYYQFSVTGALDKNVQAQIDKIYETPLQNGFRDKGTIELKANLNTLGFKVPGNGTSLFGLETEEKVKQFQQYYGLVVNGIADAITLKTIDEVLSTPLQMGKRHKNTIQLKKDLAYLGLPVPGNGTNYYGAGTKERVLQFQRAHGLIENGIVDSLTKEQITYLVEQPMGIGLKRADVIQLKKDLKSLGFQVPGNGTNYFGKQTEEKLIAFQHHYGLTTTGIVDQKTKEKLRTLLKTPLQSGFRHSDTIKLKRMLAAVGYPVPGNGTNYYGVGTAEKVREFQKSSKLPVSGIADSITLDLLDEMTDGILMYGMRDERVIQLKKNLASVGLPVPGNGTNYYGAGTEKKVKQFQKHYGLKVTGSADHKTLEKLKNVLSDEMQNGNRNKATIQLKKDLKRLGFQVPGKGTSLYGKQTEKKVKEFQKYYGLHASGIADQATLDKVKKILASPLQNGKRHKSTVQLKKDLALLGYKVSNKPTTLFAKKTEQQLKKYQKANGLIANGIVDPPTRKKLDAQVKKNTVKIFIDPGHGGSDTGATGLGLQEKNLTLDIALQAKQYLEKNYLGVDLNISRKSDVTIKLDDRSKMANSWGADYFISIHTNAHTGTAHGFESFIHNGNVSKETRKRQNEIHDYVIKEIGEFDRGQKTANFNVLRNTNMPAILLEYLFIDNPKDNAKLKQRSYRNYLGKVTAEALAKTFNLKKK